MLTLREGADSGPVSAVRPWFPPGSHGAGLGTARVGATMTLWMPDTSPKGHYTGTLTLIGA
ncbi:hypothetical protein [Dactylosporangium sp. NPDC005555]|uniref:hypothetical protein n=1 Tax=Dactylosporangium sp. NPDC005555 TaxID=3154889 RepID=UPI00339FD542